MILEDEEVQENIPDSDMKEYKIFPHADIFILDILDKVWDIHF